MRVLSVGNNYPPHHLGGYEVIQRGVDRQLRADGDAVVVLTTDYRRAGATEPDDGDVRRELRSYWRDHEWPAMSLGAAAALERHNARVFDDLLETFRPAVVAWWALGGLSLGLLERARAAGVPSILFVLDYWPIYGLERDLWTHRWRRLPAPAADAIGRATGLPARPRLAGAGRWVFCSSSMRDGVVGTDLPVSEPRLLAPGVGQVFLDAPAEPAPPAWQWRLLYAGRVVEQKGVRTAVEALAQLPDAATLRIVGPGDAAYRGELDRLVERLGVGGRVTFEPGVGAEAMVDLYRSADAVLFPVMWPEPWGLVPLEAMACGRPVLATGRGGSADFLRDGENSLLFAAGDAGALAAAVERLAGDSVLRERLREGGLVTAAAHGEAAFNRRAVDEITAVASSPERN